MNVLVWATTFGADLWSFVKYLSARPEVNVTVVMDEPETFLRQPVAELYPLNVRFVRRKAFHHLFGLRQFQADVTIMDNRVPFARTSPKGFMVWHGFGWRGPNDDKEFWWLYKSLRRHWGDVHVPNESFLWQCFGEWDFQHRTTIGGLHPHNCAVLGAASHDDLSVPVDRDLLQPFYPFDIKNRKTVLLAPTWHYGGLFGHWGDDDDLLGRFIRRILQKNANLIIRMHDAYRYDRSYRERLAGLVDRYPEVHVEYKDAAPDNYLNMQVADVLITNFSSIANLYYATGRPSIHIYPVSNSDARNSLRQYTILGVREIPVEHASSLWKLPLEENGGLMSQSFDELVWHLDMALEDPECCVDRSRAFLDKFMIGVDRRNCERLFEAMTALADGRQVAACH